MTPSLSFPRLRRHFQPDRFHHLPGGGWDPALRLLALPGEVPAAQPLPRCAWRSRSVVPAGASHCGAGAHEEGWHRVGGASRALGAGATLAGAGERGSARSPVRSSRAQTTLLDGPSCGLLQVRHRGRWRGPGGGQGSQWGTARCCGPCGPGKPEYCGFGTGGAPTPAAPPAPAAPVLTSRSCRAAREGTKSPLSPHRPWSIPPRHPCQGHLASPDPTGHRLLSRPHRSFPSPGQWPGRSRCLCLCSGPPRRVVTACHPALPPRGIHRLATHLASAPSGDGQGEGRLVLGVTWVT